MIASRVSLAKAIQFLLILSAAFSCRGDVKDIGIDPSLAIVQIIVTPPNSTIAPSDVILHQVYGINVNGDSVPVVTLWSADGGIVTSNGIFSSFKEGVFHVVATARDFPQVTDTSTLTVVAPPKTEVEVFIDPVSPILLPGETRPFHAAVILSDSSVLFNIPANWSATGGTIDAGGNYTAGQTTGTFRVIGTSVASGVADTVAVNINAVAPTVMDLVLSPDTTTLRPGESRIFRAFATYSDGTFAPAQATFSATAGTFSGSGNYTAPQVPGTYSVIAVNQASGEADTSTVTVIASSLAYITIQPTSAALTVGSQRVFSVLGTFSDSSTGPVNVNYTATGGNVTVGGIYTAGSTTGTFIVVATTPDQLFADTAAVTINTASATLASIDVSPASLSILAGGTQQFSVAGTLTDGAKVSVTVNWTASGGTISQSGLFTAPQLAGSYTVVATTTIGAIADTSLVTVNPVVTLTSIDINPSSTTVVTGAIQAFTATGRLSSGGTSAVPVNWTATGGTITSTGTYTAGNTAGTFRVIAAQQGGTLRDTAVVTIVVLPPPGSNACTNEPAGMTPLYDHPWNAVPPVGPTKDAFGWSVRSQNEATFKLSIVQDALAPKSPSSVIAGRFPQGSSGGSAPFRLDRSFGRTTTTIYFCIFTMLDPQFTNNGNTGTKFGFFLTPYIGQVGAPNHYFNLTTNVGINLQNNGATLNRNMLSSFSLVNNRGIWVKIEFLVIGNTGGNADGVARMWANGAPVLNATNVQYFLAQHPAAFSGITWNPTYGGGTNPVPYDMFQFIDHWYLSIK